MSEIIDFLMPRFVGKRFTDHSLPLEILKDLAVFDDLITETAKWLYLQENQGRKRIPKGFLEGISLKLVDIEEGSAIPKIVMVVALATGTLFPSESQEYFEKARDMVIAAVDAAENKENPSKYLPENILGYFDRIGRSLDEGECIEFKPSNPERPARLNRETRRSLVLASEKIQYYTEEVTLRGKVPEADQEKRTFTLLMKNDQHVPAQFDSINAEKVLEAFTAYSSGQKVTVKGIGRYSRSRKLQELESLESIILLDLLDVSSRLDEFSMLQNGWLDGSGKAPNAAGLQWFGSMFETYYDTRLALPHVYPTAEGGLQAEWTAGTVEITLDINLSKRTASYQSLDTVSLISCELDFDLTAESGWTKLNVALAENPGIAL